MLWPKESPSLRPIDSFCEKLRKARSGIPRTTHAGFGYGPFSREAPFLGEWEVKASVRLGWRKVERVDLRREILRLARLPSFWFKKRPLLMNDESVLSHFVICRPRLPTTPARTAASGRRFVSRLPVP